MDINKRDIFITSNGQSTDYSIISCVKVLLTNHIFSRNIIVTYRNEL